MWKKIREWFRNSRKGQAMTEYIIIVAVVAIASLAIITLFGNQIRSLFGAATKQMAGQADANPQDYSQDVDNEIDKTISNW